MSKFIGLPEYNNTRERAVALVLDHNFIGNGDGTLTLLNPRDGFDGVTRAILQALDKHEARYNPPNNTGNVLTDEL